MNFVPVSNVHVLFVNVQEQHRYLIVRPETILDKSTVFAAQGVVLRGMQLGSQK